MLSESEYADLYARMDGIPIDDKPDTMEQRSADRQRYYQTRPSVLLLREGIHAGNTGNWRKALIKIKAAIEKDPNNSQAHYYLAAAYTELGKWQNTKMAAEEALKTISRDDIWRARLLYALGDALVMLKEDAEAIRVLKQSLQYEERDPKLDVKSIREKLDLLQANRGDEIREATSKDPRYKATRGFLARLLGT